MCGVLFYHSFHAPAASRRKEFEQALALLERRGPDGGGIWGHDQLLLGHRRLAVIDNRHPAQLSQGPFFDPANNTYLSFNGEITNYLSLKIELLKFGHVFVTDSDTEVLAKAWAQWGPDCLTKLRGMFAFVMHDRSNQKTYFGRDGLGVKPLYYAHCERETIMASEIKSILAMIPPELNDDAVMEYLLFGYVARPMTMFKNILQVPPGHWGVLDRDGDLQWHAFQYRAQTKPADVGACLQESMTAYFHADAGMSLLLSGGVDSSCLAALAPTSLETYSIALADPKSDERRFQEKVAATFHHKHHSFEFGAEDLFTLLGDCTWAMDAPVFHLGSVLLHGLYKNIHCEGQIKVGITGEGADELFGGYERYRLPEAQLSDRLAKFFYKHRPTSQSLLQQLQILYPYLRRLYLSPERLQTLCPEFKIAEGCLSDRLQWLMAKPITIERIYRHDQQFHLEALLTRQDRMSSQTSIECRVPFCDQELWAHYADIPLHHKLGSLGPKTMLKEVLAKQTSEEFVSRRKKGLGLPIQEWLLATPMNDMLSLLTSTKARARGIYRSSAVEFEIKRLQANDYASSQYLMRLISLELWCTKFLDKLP